MGNYLISGGVKNGKSSYAQRLALEMAEKKAVAPVYFATMISHDSEDDERIRKHREDRKELGFETIECGMNIASFAEKIAGRVVLFDSLTALVQNELFEGRTDFSPETIRKDYERVSQKLRDELSVFLEKAASAVFVSDNIYNDGKIYDGATEIYRKMLSETEQFVAKKCQVYEMLAGNKNKVIGKEGGSLPLGYNGSAISACPLYGGTPRNAPITLIIGGSYQGKTAFAKEKFSLSDEDICVCTRDKMPDFSKKCISHCENYVAYCLKNNKGGEILSLPPQNDDGSARIIICDDIFCGVVPLDSFQRKLREECGLFLQKIAKNASVYRVFCGIGQRIK